MPRGFETTTTAVVTSLETTTDGVVVSTKSTTAVVVVSRLGSLSSHSTSYATAEPHPLTPKPASALRRRIR